jgi:hypothetical protein
MASKRITNTAYPACFFPPQPAAKRCLQPVWKTIRSELTKARTHNDIEKFSESCWKVRGFSLPSDITCIEAQHALQHNQGSRQSPCMSMGTASAEHQLLCLMFTASLSTSCKVLHSG